MSTIPSGIGPEQETILLKVDMVRAIASYEAWIMYDLSTVNGTLRPVTVI